MTRRASHAPQDQRQRRPGRRQDDPAPVDYGIRCCVLLSEHLPFDLIAMSQFLPFDMIAVLPDMKTLKRMRVGWGDVEVTPYADQYAIYDPLMKQCTVYEAHNLPSDLRRIMPDAVSEVVG